MMKGGESRNVGLEKRIFNPWGAASFLKLLYLSEAAWINRFWNGNTQSITGVKCNMNASEKPPH